MIANGTRTHEPLVRIAKRRERSRAELILLRAAAFLLAIVAGGAFIALLGHSPIEVYAEIFKGAFAGNKRDPLSAVKQTLVFFVPLIVTSLGLSLAFRMKFWNIGGEGQIIMGGIFATIFALYSTDNPGAIPSFILLPLMFVAGALGGGLMALLPAIFKIKFGTNETLFTLMLNYIALYFLKYLVSGPWQRTPGFASIGNFDKSARMWEIGGFHASLLVAAALVIFVHFYIKKSKQGYEISVVGESQPTARYAGMNVGKIILRTMFLSGAICGMVGMIKVSSTYTLTEGITGGVGFTGITVAWLSQFNALGMVLVSLLFAILQKGSSVMQTSLGLSADASNVLQGIILFSFLGTEFFTRYKFVFKKNNSKEKE
ncbi:MAG: ABC transporter permease [Oscillospiraceae bacterium]|jgi:simple sugar transport system permease protein|nr:ABC transporter permease [Oscillospiraceae bacterium]